MARIQSTREQFNVARQATLAATQAILVKLAKTKHAELMNDDPRPGSFRRWVDGNEGAAEESVKGDGVIVYRYSRLGVVAQFALQFLVDRSPELSGEFKRSWFISIDGEQTGDLGNIPGGATIAVSNDRPYWRKIEVGHMHMSVPHHLIEDAVTVVGRSFGNIAKLTAGVISISNPYILKGHFHRGFRPSARTGLHKDTQAGAVMTYPALIITER